MRLGCRPTLGMLVAETSGRIGVPTDAGQGPGSDCDEQ
jgi:hypothetical protein